MLTAQNAKPWRVDQLSTAANGALASTTATTDRLSFYLSSTWRYRHSCEYESIYLLAHTYSLL